jgi:2-amino-4-hydroxy-6-hydroxymethyldihydropteridine diphosphokinase
VTSTDPPAICAAVALGSNLADPEAQVRRAFEELAAIPDTRLVARSRLYRTRAVGPPQPDYVNAVALLETRLEADALFDRLLGIETAHGRVRGERWGPRTLDLDLLVYGDAVIDTPRLSVPHPQLALRSFVLVPLASVAPALEVPGLGRVDALCAACAPHGIVALETDHAG